MNCTECHREMRGSRAWPVCNPCTRNMAARAKRLERQNEKLQKELKEKTELLDRLVPKDPRDRP